MAPPAGFEPATHRLTGDCSTAELQGNVTAKVMLSIQKPYVQLNFCYI